MRVLLVGRPALVAGGGGDKVQVLKTQEYLNRLGVRADVTFDPSPDYRGYDLAHLFTLSTWMAGKAARRYGIPYVLSPIFWYSPRAEAWIRSHSLLPGPLRYIRDLTERVPGLRVFTDVFRWSREVWRLHGAARLGFARAARIAAASGLPGLSCRVRVRRELLDGAAVVMPGAEAEMANLQEVFGGAHPYVVVPLGVDCEDPATEGASGEFRCQDLVLSVAAGLNYRKNQLGLIKALRGTGLRLVIVGSSRNGAEQRYEQECRRAADNYVTFLPAIPRDQLKSLYARARVFALPSLFESPGLVYLEAAVSGCAVVATKEGSAPEYLGAMAWYCDPYDLDSIRESVMDAVRLGPDPNLAEYVRSHYTWERMAERLVAVYAAAMGEHCILPDIDDCC